LHIHFNTRNKRVRKLNAIINGQRQSYIYVLQIQTVIVIAHWYNVTPNPLTDTTSVFNETKSHYYTHKTAINRISFFCEWKCFIAGVP